MNALDRIGKYELLEPLGRGISGEVWIARDTVLRRDVALKIITGEVLNWPSLFDEARIVIGLGRHDHIVQIFDADQVNGHSIIVMELVRGGTLMSRIDRETQLPWRDAIRLCREVLLGLEAAHGQKIFHKDIKPLNILLTETGAAKLADFGISEVLATSMYAQAGGTYPYMAPEMFAEEPNPDLRSDLWSVGVVLYRMLTGNLPFRAAKNTPFAWKRAVEEQKPPLLSDFPSLSDAPCGLQDIIDTAFNRDKKYRYQSALGFRVALDTLQIDEPLVAGNYRRQGDALYNKKRYDEAAQSYLKAIADDPNNVALIYTLGDTYYYLKSYSEAETYYHKALQLNPKLARPYNGLGSIHYDLQRYPESEASYRKALELDPNFAYSHNGLGSVYWSQQRYVEAEKSYLRAVELEPDLASAHSGLGNVYWSTQRYAQAETCYRKALDIDPTLASSHCGLGHVCWHLKRQSEAEACYRKAIEIDPKMSHAYAGLGNVYIIQNRDRDAIKAYSEAVRLNPDQADYRDRLKNLHEK